MFDITYKKIGSPSKRTSTSNQQARPNKTSNGQSDVGQDDEDEGNAEEEEEEDLVVVKEEPEECDEIVDEVGEVDKENFQDLHKFNDVRSNLNDSNNVDNEDSLNLTIGEDEEKIFQDEVITINIYVWSLFINIIYLFLFSGARRKGKGKNW